MSEPLTPAAAIIASISGVTLAVLGQDYYSLLYAFIGSAISLTWMSPMGRFKTVLVVILSTVAGAALGTGAIGGSSPLLRGACLVGGAGALSLLAALVRAAVQRISPNDKD